VKFHPLDVVSVDRIAEDAVSISLAIPAALEQEFGHHAGQYVSIRRTIDGREELRTYSIVTPPGRAHLRIGVRVQPAGRMSNELALRLRAGDKLEVGTPLGRFRTAIDPARVRSYVAFAAGSGITPVLCLAEDILAREPSSRFTLVYGNRSTARTMFLEETLALKNRRLGRFAVHFVMSREPQHMALLNGRIDAAKVETLARELTEIGKADEYFVCGPGEMAEEVRDVLKRINPDAPIRLERFVSSVGGAAAARTNPMSEAPAVSVVADGRRRTFPMASRDASVLEAAERAGLRLPFSCRAGICATCRTKVKSGHVEMVHNIALEPWELAAGFVLCCQARPTTPTLELSYDEK
jgi:ring-1,2-phenylacetyl-CoA epoxidase subunit PaaE